MARHTHQPSATAQILIASFALFMHLRSVTSLVPFYRRGGALKSWTRLFYINDDDSHNHGQTTYNDDTDLFDDEINVEHEAISELEERIRFGSSYEPIGVKNLRDCGDDDSDIDDADVPTYKGVFCGFVVTKEETERLKSANPVDYDERCP